MLALQMATTADDKVQAAKSSSAGRIRDRATSVFHKDKTRNKYTNQYKAAAAAAPELRYVSMVGRWAVGIGWSGRMVGIAVNPPR
jgi:hypothetical protein